MRKSGEGRSRIFTVKMMKTKMVWPGKSRLSKTLYKNMPMLLFKPKKNPKKEYLPGMACGCLVSSLPDPHLQPGKSPQRALCDNF